MAQTAQQRREAARELARRLFSPQITADLDLDDLSAAIGAIDVLMDALPGALHGALSVKQNLIAALPEPFRSRSTAEQKALALTIWALKEARVI